MSEQEGHEFLFPLLYQIEMNQSVFEKFFGEKWWEKHLRTTLGTMSRLETPSDRLLRKLNSSPHEVSEIERLRLWLMLRKPTESLRKDFLLIIHHLWEYSLHKKEYSLFYLLVFQVFYILQRHQLSFAKEDLEILEDKESREDNLLQEELKEHMPSVAWDELWIASFLEATITSLRACSRELISQQQIKAARFLFDVVSQLSQEDSFHLAKWGDSIIKNCVKRTKKQTPMEQFAELNLPQRGRLNRCIFGLCKEYLLSEPWHDWELVKMRLNVVEEQEEETYYRSLSQLLEDISDTHFGDLKDKFFRELREKFGHPLSVHSDWRRFSHAAKERMISWGGRVQIQDLSRIYRVLKKVGYFEDLDRRHPPIKTKDKRIHTNKMKAESRLGFWSEYREYMRYVRFFLSPEAYEYLERAPKSDSLIRETAVGRIRGSFRGKTVSDVCLMEFEPFVVLEFLYIPSNWAYFYSTSTYLNNKDIFSAPDLDLSAIAALECLKIRRHTPGWKEDCREEDLPSSWQPLSKQI